MVVATPRPSEPVAVTPTAVATRLALYIFRSPWPYALTGSAAAYFLLPPSFVIANHDMLKDVVLAALGIAAIAASFLMTALSILITIAKERVMRNIQQLGHGRGLLQIFGTCVWFYLAVVLMSTVLLASLGVATSTWAWRGELVLWAGIAAGALATTMRVFRLYQEILEQQLS